MRSFTTAYRLQGLSVPEIAGEFEEAVLRIGRRHDFNGRKLKPGPLLNALVMWFLSLPEETRVDMAGEWLARLESFLSDTPEERAGADEKLRSLLSGVQVSGDVQPPEPRPAKDNGKRSK